MAVCSLMARIRSVHPAICTDEVLAELPASAERLFVRLWTHLDDDGRCVEHHKILKAALFPLHDDYTVDDLAADIGLLVSHGQLIRYVRNGKTYLTAKPDRWAEWQKPRRKIDSKLPAPTRADIVGTPRDNDGTRAAVDGGERRGDGLGAEGESEGEGPRYPLRPQAVGSTTQGLQARSAVIADRALSTTSQEARHA